MADERKHPYRNAVILESNSGSDEGPLTRITWEAWYSDKGAQVDELQKLYLGLRNHMEGTTMERAAKELADEYPELAKASIERVKQGRER